MCGLGTPGVPREPSRVSAVKTIFRKMLRHYLPFSHSFFHECKRTFSETGECEFITVDRMAKPV